MKIFLLMMGLVFIAMPAHAEDAFRPECLMPKHSNMGAAYVPGVDVRGKAVVPADVGAGTAPAAMMPGPMVVPVTIDLAQRVGLSVPGLEMNGTAGFLEIHPDGRVVYNGVDLTQKVNVACGRVNGEPASAPVPENAPIAPAVTDGQRKPDVIEYAPVKENAPNPTVKPLQAPEPPAPKQGELLEGGEYAE